MMTLDRRMLMGAAAALAGTTMTGTGPALAEAPLAKTQLPGAYRFKLGDFEVTALHDGAGSRPLDANFVKNASLADVQAELAANFLPTDTLTISFTALLVNTGSKLILLDTGFADNGGPTNGRIAGGLKAAGVDPKAIDAVVISHFHGDHISGLRAKDGALVYPNAEIHVPEAEWAFWMDDAKMAAAPEGMRGGFQGARRVFAPIAKDVKQFAWGKEPVSGITAIDAKGHTPGHTAFAIASGKNTLLYVADITNNPVLFAKNPDWTAVFDMDGPQAIATRKKILDMAATDKLGVSFYHASFPATGNVAKDGAGYRFVPAAYSTAL